MRRNSKCFKIIFASELLRLEFRDSFWETGLSCVDDGRLMGEILTVDFEVLCWSLQVSEDICLCLMMVAVSLPEKLLAFWLLVDDCLMSPGIEISLVSSCMFVEELFPSSAERNRNKKRLETERVNRYSKFSYFLTEDK